jgi:hypothetical protein
MYTRKTQQCVFQCIRKIAPTCFLRVLFSQSRPTQTPEFCFHISKMSTNYGIGIEILVRSVKWLHRYIITTVLSYTSYVVTWTEQTSTKAASDLVYWSPASHRGGPGSIRSQSTEELWWTKWAHLHTEPGCYLPVLLRQVSTPIYLFIYPSYTLCNFNGDFKQPSKM